MQWVFAALRDLVFFIYRINPKISFGFLLKQDQNFLLLYKFTYIKQIDLVFISLFQSKVIGWLVFYYYCIF